MGFPSQMQEYSTRPPSGARETLFHFSCGGSDFAVEVLRGRRRSRNNQTPCYLSWIPISSMMFVLLWAHICTRIILTLNCFILQHILGRNLLVASLIWFEDNCVAHQTQFRIRSPVLYHGKGGSTTESRICLIQYGTLESKFTNLEAIFAYASTRLWT